MILHLRGGDLIQKRPIAYQLKGGVHQPVPVDYRLVKDQSIAFEIGTYDESLPLVIDPSFVYSTRFSGSRQDEPRGIAVDAMGAAYVTGLTYSTDFPTVQPLQSKNGAHLRSVSGRLYLKAQSGWNPTHLFDIPWRQHG